MMSPGNTARNDQRDRHVDQKSRKRATSWAGQMLWQACLITVLAVPAIRPAYGGELPILTEKYYEHPSVFRQFIEKYNFAPSFAYSSLASEALAMVQNGLAADASRICTASLTQWEEASVLVPWDVNKLRNFEPADVVARMSQALTPYEDKFFPYEYGTTRLIYDSHQVPREDVATLNVFLNPVYSGKVSLPRDPNHLVAAALLATGTTSWDDVSDVQLDRALEWIEAVHPHVHSYWDDVRVLSANLARGTVLVAWAWNSILVEYVAFNPRLQFAPDTSGVSAWVCGYVRLTRDETRAEALHDFVNAHISTAAARKLLSWGLGHADKGAMDKLSTPSELQRYGLTLPDAQVFFETPMPAWVRTRMTHGVELILANM